MRLLHRKLLLLPVLLTVLFSTLVPSGVTATAGPKRSDSSLIMVEPLHLPTTEAHNGTSPKAFLKKLFGRNVEDLRSPDTYIELDLSVTEERTEDMDIEGSGHLTVGGIGYELEGVSGHLVRLDVKGARAVQGMVTSQLPDGTDLTITITHLLGSNKTWIVGFFGALNAESGILLFGQPFKEALEDIPDALEREFTRKNGPRPQESDRVSLQANCDSVHYNYGYPPDSTGSDFRGRRWQQIVDSCGWTQGAVMLWAPDNVSRGQGLNYGSRLWSDTFGAQKGFEANYGFVKDVAVWKAELRLTMPSVFQNSGHTSPLVGTTGSNVVIPMAKLLGLIGCSYCWAVPNVTIPMNYTSAALSNVDGGVYNQFAVVWYTAFSFSPTDTDYSSSAEPYKDEKGFALMSPFSRQNVLSGTSYYTLRTQGTIYYRARAAFGTVTATVPGESLSWVQTNQP